MDFLETLSEKITERMIIAFVAGIGSALVAILLQHLIAWAVLPVVRTYYQKQHVIVQPTLRDQLLTAVTPKLMVKAALPTLTAASSPAITLGGDVQKAASYILVDGDAGSVLAEKKADTQMPIASLTKVMTAMVALDLADTKESFAVTKRAAAQIPTKIGVVAGQHMPLGDLLHALLLTSANDAADVIRDGIDAKYGGAVFVEAMNKKASLLGLGHTHFANPQGFDDPQNYSTAHDLAVLSLYALSHYPVIHDIAQKDYYFIPATAEHKQFDLYNWNGLIGTYPDTMGVKIGSTPQAGKTTIVLSERQGKRMLAVVLGAPTILDRDLWASQLLDAGYQALFALPPVSLLPKKLQEKYASWKTWN
jgi:D-alanyl-D-alanine carboxypeptidase